MKYKYSEKTSMKGGSLQVPDRCVTWDKVKKDVPEGKILIKDVIAEGAKLLKTSEFGSQIIANM